MLKKILLCFLTICPLISHADLIKFCINNSNVMYPQFTLDSKLYYYNATDSVRCFDHTPVGNKLVLFTNGFDLNYNGIFCGHEDPCIIPISNVGKLNKLSAFVSKQNNVISGSLVAEYT